MSEVTPKQALSDALRYWEPRRLLYNAVLALVVTAVFLSNLPGARTSATFDAAQILFVLAILANIAYCAAHAVDVVLQLSTYRPLWLRIRWILLALGITFAAILTNFFAHGFFATGAGTGS